jgi:hypothetical protein
MYDRLLDLIAQRPHSTVVAAGGAEWATYQRLLVALGEQPQTPRELAPG